MLEFLLNFWAEPICWVTYQQQWHVCHVCPVQLLPVVWQSTIVRKQYEHTSFRKLQEVELHLQNNAVTYEKSLQNACMHIRIKHSMQFATFRCLCRHKTWVYMCKYICVRVCACAYKLLSGYLKYTCSLKVIECNSITRSTEYTSTMSQYYINSAFNIYCYCTTTSTPHLGQAWAHDHTHNDTQTGIIRDALYIRSIATEK